MPGSGTAITNDPYSGTVGNSGSGINPASGATSSGAGSGILQGPMTSNLNSGGNTSGSVSNIGGTPGSISTGGSGSIPYVDNSGNPVASATPGSSAYDAAVAGSSGGNGSTPADVTSMSSGDTYNYSQPTSTSQSYSQPTYASYSGGGSSGFAQGGVIPTRGSIRNTPGLIGHGVSAHAPQNATTGGKVPYGASPSQGKQTDDVNANLNAGEFVIPRDVTEWKGQEFFQKLIQQSRKARVTAPAHGKPGAQPQGPPGFTSQASQGVLQGAPNG